MQKRACLSYLPNVMIVHLQRMYFNLDTLQNEKLNSRLEFPQLLNLEPYTREGLQLREGGALKLKKQSSFEGNNETNENDDDSAKYQNHPKEYYEYTLKGSFLGLKLRRGRPHGHGLIRPLFLVYLDQGQQVARV